MEEAREGPNFLQERPLVRQLLSSFSQLRPYRISQGEKEGVGVMIRLEEEGVGVSTRLEEEGYRRRGAGERRRCL